MQPLGFGLVIEIEMNVQPDYEIVHEDLIDGCKRGDGTAFREIYRLYSRAMYNTCLRMMNNREEAEDILQESFASAFRNIHRYRKESAFGAWLKQIVINRCINALNKRSLQLAELKEGYEFKDEDTEERNVPDSYDVAMVKQAIAKLPDGYRSVLNLYLLEGYDHKEIAEILSISESTSKTQYLRAKKRLQSILKEMPYEG